MYLLTKGTLEKKDKQRIYLVLSIPCFFFLIFFINAYVAILRVNMVRTAAVNFLLLMKA